jgi:hypothetical protein
VKILGETRDRYGFSLVGHAVMPEHVHLRVSEARRGKKYHSLSAWTFFIRPPQYIVISASFRFRLG